MKTFLQFITEAAADNKSHLTHLEDFVFDGPEGVSLTLEVLNEVGGALAGGGVTKALNLRTKIDGCLHADTQILTNAGIKSIKELVEHWHINSDICVLGQIDGAPVYVPVKDAFQRRLGKPWVKVELSEGSIIATSDHPIMTTNRGWVKAGELIDGDDVEELAGTIDFPK